MNHVYKIKLLDGKKSTVVINPNTADYLGILKTKNIILRFGSLRLFANITLSIDIADTEIQLTSKLIASLHLPEFSDYELSVCQNELIIGPFIGMLMSREDKNLTPSFLEKMKIYVSDYGKLHGAIVVFALDKVDAVGRLVEGYCYNPITQNFEKGVYPFPASIYRTIGLSEHWKNRFYSVLGDRLFNNYYFNKWEMYQWYYNTPDLSDRVPYTCVFKTAQDVFNMLQKYSKVYIKPMSGLGGRRITQIKFNYGEYVFKYREKGINYIEVIGSKEKAAEYIDAKFSLGKYIIQQPIELIEIEGRIVDFRCIMQKNQSQEWACQAIIGRYGAQGSIVSNISSGGEAFGIDSIPKSSIPLTKSQALHLGDDITTFALRICNALDEYGVNCGTLGLDIGVDINGNLWLIEINNRDPDPTIALDAHDRPLYEKLKTGILLYAKALSGFSSTQDA